MIRHRLWLYLTPDGWAQRAAARRYWRNVRIDVTNVPVDQLRRLLESDKPDPAPGLRAMAARRRR